MQFEGEAGLDMLRRLVQNLRWQKPLLTMLGLLVVGENAQDVAFYLLSMNIADTEVVLEL